MAFISGRMTCSSFYVTAFSIGPLLGVPSYFVGGGVIGFWRNIYLYHEKSVGSLFGEVVDREWKYLGEGAFGHLGASGKEASGI